MATRWKERAEAGAVLAGGLSAGAFAGIFLLIPMEELGWAGLIALSSFSLALPLLILVYGKCKLVPRREHTRSNAVALPLASGYVLVVAGLFFSILEASAVAAGVFLVAALIATFLWDAK